MSEPEKRDDGGPAFPQDPAPSWSDLKAGHPGMSLRDHFAGEAMAAMIGEPDWGQTCTCLAYRLSGAESVALQEADRFAVAAYKMADAMIKARSAA